jgi:hypothetical protein
VRLIRGKGWSRPQTYIKEEIIWQNVEKKELTKKLTRKPTKELKLIAKQEKQKLVRAADVVSLLLLLKSWLAADLAATKVA